MTVIRSLFPVLDSLHPTESVGQRQPREQIFTSPGTWTWTAGVAWVEVLLVGGGGGTPVNAQGGGGGGGIRREFVPVTGPVPVTVGAGGLAGTGPTQATAGGSSSFGPISVGGGGTGIGPLTTGTNASAPPTGGGGGGGGSPGPFTVLAATGGTYGQAGGLSFGGAGGFSQKTGGAGSGNYFQPIGQYTYGGGGSAFIWGPVGSSPAVMNDGGGTTYNPGEANRGGGAGGGNPAPGYAGGSGIVHVRWWQ